MYDASAKIPSGLLSGNINQYGDFDECLNTVGPSKENIQGKYCLSYIQIAVPSVNLPRLKYIRKLMHSHDAFVNDFNDVSFDFFQQKPLITIYCRLNAFTENTQIQHDFHLAFVE